MKKIIILFMSLSFAMVAHCQDVVGNKSAVEYYKSAHIKDSLKDYSGAISDYSSAIALDANYADAYVGRGNSYFYSSKYSESVADFDKAIDLQSDNGYAYYCRGWSYVYLENYDAACDDFDAAYYLGIDDALWASLDYCE